MGLFDAIGGLVGGIFGGGPDYDAMRQRYQDWNPDIQARYGQYQSAGPTQLGSIDPTSRNTMLQGIAALRNQYNKGGLDDSSRAALQGANIDSIAAANRANKGTLAQLAARGIDPNVAANFMAEQGSGLSQGLTRNALGAAAMAGQRRDAALQGMMGGAMNLYGIDASRAQAQDAINRFNTANWMNVSQQNADTYNQMETGNRNREMSKIAGMNGVDMSQGLANQQRWSAIGSGLGGLVDTGIGMFGGPGGVGGWFDRNYGTGSQKKP